MNRFECFLKGEIISSFFGEGNKESSKTYVFKKTLFPFWTHTETAFLSLSII